MTIIQNYSSEFYYLFSQAAPRAGRPGRRGAQAPRRSRGAQAFFKKSLGSFFF